MCLCPPVGRHSSTMIIVTKAAVSRVQKYLRERSECDTLPIRLHRCDVCQKEFLCATLQQPHAYSAFSNAGDHKMLCWCCSPFCVPRYMGTVAWMGLRGEPCYLLAASWHSLAKLSCTCTASSWKLSDRGERPFHHDVWLRMHACTTALQRFI